MTLDEESLEFWKRLPRYPVRTQELMSNTIGQQLLVALKNGHQLEITYAGRDKPVSKRTICPLEAASVAGVIYIRAYCLLRQEERTFRLDRILNALILDERNSYQPSSFPNKEDRNIGSDQNKSDFAWLWWLIGIGLTIFLLFS